MTAASYAAAPLWFLLGALFGSVPFGLLIGLVFYRVDIRRHGSGNIGAANAMRTIGRAGAIMVLLLDALKGFVPTAFAVVGGHFAFGGDPQATAAAFAAGAGACLGHCFTPWLRFRGGKGVATLLGVLLALAWPAALAAVLVYAAVVAVGRVSAIGSLCAALAGTAGLALRIGAPGAIFGLACTALLVYTHRENIARLRAGRELTVGTGGGSGSVRP